MREIAMAALAAAALSTPVAAQTVPNEVSLRAADAMQMRIIITGDATAQQAFMHPNYIINGPSNRVMRKDQLVSMLAAGQMASSAFERTIEAVQITENVGIVMGREAVTPTTESKLGKQFGDKPLARRFTNVFLWTGGKWRFLARQATVIVGP